MQIQLLDPKAKIPVRKHATDAGYDLHCLESFTIHPQSQMIVKTGIAIALPENTAGLIWNRSGLSCGSVTTHMDSNTDQGLDTTAGLIDMGYRGELLIALNNNSSLTRVFNAGDRIAQLLLVPVVTPTLEVVSSLPSADRGDNGFGSTGNE
jgi:dUTP pyrophosphatase